MSSSRQPEFPADGAPIPAVARPGLLYAAGLPDASIQPLIQVLEQAGIATRSAGPDHHSFQWQPVTDGGLNHIEAQLKERADAHLLLFYQAPAIVLAEAMGNGHSPDNALSDWIESIEAILSVIRQFRRRITLVEMTLAHQDPNRLIERLNQRLALSLSRRQREASWQPSQLDPVHLVIAQSVVLKNAAARRLASELQATALPIADESSLLPDPLSAWNTYTRRAEKAEVTPAQENELRELKEENELLLLQLHQVQEELECYFLENRDLKKIRKELARTKKRLESRERTLKYIYDSKSWKLTAPLRRFLKVFSRDKTRRRIE